jgi:hypothetical protein
MTKDREEELRERLVKIAEIFSDAVLRAQSMSKSRCPYRNRFDHCTAAFSCRNQLQSSADEQLKHCGHDGVFDYRLAWESDPRNHDRAKQKIREIRSQARTNRSPTKSGS